MIGIGSGFFGLNRLVAPGFPGPLFLRACRVSQLLDA